MAKLNYSLFLFITLGFYLIFIGYPIVSLFYHSFTNLTISNLTNPSFIGLQNYFKLFGDERFLYNFFFTLELMIYSVPLSLLIALGVSSLLVSDKILMKDYLTLAFLLPWVTPIVAWAMSIRYLFSPGSFFSVFLKKILGYSLNVFSDKVGAKIFLIINLVWIGAPVATLFLISAFLSIPINVIEAAKLDGASSFSLFKNIIFPLIKKKFLIVFVLTVGSIIMGAEAILAFTGGGPGYATETLAIRMFMEGRMFYNFGYASAIGLFLLIVGTIIILIMASLMREKA
jgi:multiple sugar transport system permease protein/raffinose/stachyose/melibiose transport system permease protein